ncbi:hypothetical protein FGIG_12316 [Fasciola gigantica]|uniref:RING-type domain-containing protein n=1 Tax=Fasciola gigantica TaxID=46835 RepID=A0A504Y695_FASGI|nr:hypothetical protein FGIG_12316 [Fasciola gigantica]
MSSGINVVRLAETFVRAPIFSLAFGAFAKLYEDEACPTNYKALVWSKLTEFCITLHTSRKNVCNLLIRADVACSNRFPEILACIVCREIYFHPVVLFCGHAFCRRCLDARFNCHCCSSSSTSGELNDCLLLSKIIQSFFPDVASLHQRLDELSAMTAKGHYAEALAAVDQLLEQYPNNVRCLQTKVDACLLNSDFDTALFITDKAMEHGFLVPKWFCLKARALKGLGHRRRALEYLFKCFTVYPYSDCLRSEITLVRRLFYFDWCVNEILDEVITTADVTQWKNVVQLCTADSTSVLDVISVEFSSNLPEDAKTTVFIEPWMQLSLTCQTTETTLIMLHEPPFNLSDELHPTKGVLSLLKFSLVCRFHYCYQRRLSVCLVFTVSNSASIHYTL